MTTAQVSSLTMFAIGGGAPWVVAESPEAALAVATAQLKEMFPGSPSVYTEARAMATDEPFTMCYESAEDVPAELDRDTQSPCLNCGDDHRPESDDACVSVTMSAAEWCEFLGAGYVIWDFQA